MSTKQQAKVVHESETQRQFVRVRLPAQVEIQGIRFYVKDISSGGAGIQDIELPLKKGQDIPVTLILPFLDFSLDIQLTAQIQYQDKKLKTAGCRFINLSPGQLSTLTHVIKSYIAGDIVTSEGLLHTVSRDNFVKVRSHKSKGPASTNDKVRMIAAYTSISVIALALAFFILANIFERMFILKTDNATVSAETMIVESPTRGAFLSLLPEGSASVEKGQPLARIPKAESSVFATDRIIVSPCDCFIKEQFVTNNEFGAEVAKT